MNQQDDTPTWTFSPELQKTIDDYEKIQAEYIAALQAWADAIVAYAQSII